MVRIILSCFLLVSACQSTEAKKTGAKAANCDDKDKGATKGAQMKKYAVQKTDDEWRKILTPEQFHILREQGTERAFTGAYYQSHDKAHYVCAACGQQLFASEQKYDSGSGWPSFYAPAQQSNVETEEDSTHGMVRTEVRCSRCGSHLGHVFTDGPKPTGLRYCINSASLKAVKK